MSARRRTQGGQILPMFAIFLIVLFGMAAMVVDGGFMLESKSDLQTVAQHAADYGAQMIDVTAYNSGCVNRLSDPLCQSSLRLTAGSGGTAATRAKNVVCQWLDPLGTLSTTALRLPSVPVSGCPPDTATPPGGSVVVSANGDTITVTITRCYRPYFADVLLGVIGPRGGCPSGTVAISATATATAAEGY